MQFIPRLPSRPKESNLSFNLLVSTGIYHSGSGIEYFLSIGFDAQDKTFEIREIIAIQSRLSVLCYPIRNCGVRTTSCNDFLHHLLCFIYRLHAESIDRSNNQRLPPRTPFLLLYVCVPKGRNVQIHSINCYSIPSWPRSATLCQYTVYYGSSSRYTIMHEFGKYVLYCG